MEVTPYSLTVVEAAVSDTRAAVEEIYDAYGRRDFEHVGRLLHPDIDWVIYSPVTVFPFAGPRHGPAAVLKVMAEIAQSYDIASYKREVVIVDGDRAAVMSDVGFLQRTTRRSLRFRIANFLRFQDGLLIEFREFANTFDVVEQALGRELPL